MQLQPRRQPGRTDRKAAVYASEILRLRAEGYTYEAIREALADLGIELSTSALRREVRRHRQRGDSASSGTRSASRMPTNAARSSPPALPNRLPSLAGTSGREIAEAFFNAHPSNPLLHAKEVP
jgi:hypothetical protein